MRLQLGDNVCICNRISASRTTSGNRPSKTLVGICMYIYQHVNVILAELRQKSS